MPFWSGLVLPVLLASIHPFLLPDVGHFSEGVSHSTFEQNLEEMKTVVLTSLTHGLSVGPAPFWHCSQLPLGFISGKKKEPAGAGSQLC